MQFAAGNHFILYRALGVSRHENRMLPKTEFEHEGIIVVGRVTRLVIGSRRQDAHVSFPEIERFRRTVKGHDSYVVRGSMLCHGPPLARFRFGADPERARMEIV